MRLIVYFAANLSYMRKFLSDRHIVILLFICAFVVFVLAQQSTDQNEAKMTSLPASPGVQAEPVVISVR